MAFTPNFDIEIPDVGGDFDTWGGILNAAIGVGGAGPASGDTLDQLIQDNLDAAAAAAVTADAALPKAGGAMTGRLDEFSATLQKVDLGATPSGVLVLDLALGNFFFAGTPSGAITSISFANTPSVAPATVIAFLSIDQGGTFGMIFDPGVILWPGGAAGPSPISPTGRDLFGFYTLDPEAVTPTWYGSLAQSDVR